jgi:REP element-mobilizing transposase RayT
MPNHVHVLIELKARDQLSKILHSWKSYTAKRINEVVGGSGEVWQKEYYDRLIRDSAHYQRTVRYIRKNAEVVEGINARAARCTIATRCTEGSRTGCQPVQD